MPGQFDGKVVMVTGAAGAVARGVLEKFAAEGATLALVDVRQERLEQAVQEVGDRLGRHTLQTGDLGDVEQTDAVIQRIVSELGRIDTLVHIAGGFAAGTPVHETGIDVFEKMIYLNARLTYVACGRVARYMVQQGIPGTMVAVLARSALQGSKGTAAYSASKAAAQRIVESMAAELREHGIRINGVMPSIADTPANRKAMPNADFSKWVTPQQIAEAIAFLASDAASAISGDSLAVYHDA